VQWPVVCADKAAFSGGEREQMYADWQGPLSAQCSAVSLKNAAISVQKALKRPEKMDRYLGENVSFWGFSGK